MTITLSASYLSTVLYALAKTDTQAARETIIELEKQGAHVPAWIKRDVL